MKNKWFHIDIKMLLSCLICIAPSFTYSQTTSYSQYNYTPFQVNPGFLSVKNEAIVILNNRNTEFGVSANSTMLSAIYPFVNEGNKIMGGVGLNVFMNKFGDPQVFRNSGVSIGYSHNVTINKNNIFSLGIVPSYIQKGITTEGLTTANQWNNLQGFSSSVELGENLASNFKSYFDLSSGLLWYGVDNLGKEKFHLGIAGYSLNRPNQSFYSKEYNLPIRYILEGGFKLYENRNFTFSPEGQLSKNAYVNNFILGSQINYQFNASPFSALKKGSITIITRYSSEKLFVGGMQFNQPHFSLGFSYDHSISKISNNQGGMEVMLAIRQTIVKRKKIVKTVDSYSIGEVRDFYKKETKEGKGILNNTTEIEENEARAEGEEVARFALKREFKFKFNDSEIIDEGDIQFMADLIKLLNGNKKLKTEIIGHADNVGKEEMNQKISEQRAQKVYDYLISKGIQPSRLLVKGKGASEPLFSNDNELNRAKNRRVEFIIFK